MAQSLPEQLTALSDRLDKQEEIQSKLIGMITEDKIKVALDDKSMDSVAKKVTERQRANVKEMIAKESLKLDASSEALNKRMNGLDDKINNSITTIKKERADAVNDIKSQMTSSVSNDILQKNKETLSRTKSATKRLERSTQESVKQQNKTSITKGITIGLMIAITLLTVGLVVGLIWLVSTKMPYGIAILAGMLGIPLAVVAFRSEDYNHEYLISGLKALSIAIITGAVIYVTSQVISATWLVWFYIIPIILFMIFVGYTIKQRI